MDSTEERTSGHTSTKRHLSRSAMVVVRFTGPALARQGVAPAWEPHSSTRHDLGLDDLRWLVRSRSEGIEADQPDAAGEAGFPAHLWEVLSEFGLMVEGDEAQVPVDPGSPSPGTAISPPPGSTLRLALPLACSIGASTFDVFDHDGSLVAALTPEELLAASSFCSPRTVDSAFADQSAVLGPAALDATAHRLLVAHLMGKGLLGEHEEGVSVANAQEEALRAGLAANMRLRSATAEMLAKDFEHEPDGGGRAKVIAVQVAGNVPPLSTGMVVAAIRSAAQADEQISSTFDLRPRWIFDAEDAVPSTLPTVYLFTNYIWSHEQNLEFSRALKERDPRAITVHGGPDCPSYPRETEAYLRTNDQVDIMVRGEGEQTAAELFKALAATILEPGGPDLSTLRDVPGLAYRHGDETVRTPDRERITDVNSTPSPFLTGIFDVFADAGGMGLAIIETNRGCPYGCTFCDWGSATNSRIRKFDFDRVLAEFEWCARNKVEKVFLADANFGIMSRDVDTARHMVALKRQYGYPKRLITNYAKNTVKHLREIVEILAEGDVLSEGLLSLQTMDESTLAAIRRSNIKLEKYEALSREFHEARMPLFVDLMLGLPGQTVESFRDDLQQCVDREVNAKVHLTELLVNSPMNDPEYRAEHKVVTSRPPGATGQGVAAAAVLGPSLVVSTSTFTRDEYRDMDALRRTYLLVENLGVMRHVSRFVRRETGIAEVTLVERLMKLVSSHPSRWPALEATLLAVPNVLVPPVSWAFYIEDLRSAMVEEIGLEPGPPLETVLAVQHAVLPAPSRPLPLKVDLPHDYPAWYRSVMAAKNDGHIHDWDAVVGRLGDLGPGELDVDDPDDVAGRNLGFGTSLEPYLDWELQSSVARAMPRHYRVN